MAQNYYRWTAALDHLDAKVDTLFKNFDKLTVSAVTPAPVLPPCKVYGMFGYTGVECQLGSVVGSLEQVSYSQYRQANDVKRALRGRQPTSLIAFILFVLRCFILFCR